MTGGTRSARWGAGPIVMVAIGALLGGFVIGLGSLLLRGTPGPSQVAAGSGQPSPTIASASAGQTAAASETPLLPSASPTPEPARPVPGSIAVVAADGLRLRTAPEVSAGVRRQIARGREVYIVSGPTMAGGYGWYEIAALDVPSPSYGWAAGIGPEGEAWLEPSSEACPASPTDLAGLAAHPRLRWLSCLRNATMTLRAFVPVSSSVGIGCVGWPGFTPEMLAICNFVPVTGDETLGNLSFVYLDPSLGDPCSDGPGCAFNGWEDRWVELDAHVDDPAAANCRGGAPADAPSAQWRQMSSGELVLLCRQQVVVTAIRSASAP